MNIQRPSIVEQVYRHSKLLTAPSDADCFDKLASKADELMSEYILDLDVLLLIPSSIDLCNRERKIGYFILRTVCQSW